MLYHLATETLSQVDYKVHMTCILHTARIRNVNSIMFVNRIRGKISFELGAHFLFFFAGRNFP